MQMGASRLGRRTRLVGAGVHLAVSAAALCHGTPAAAALPGDPPPTRGERLEFDPQADRWRVVASPVAGSEDGDLELARAQLARGEFRAARRSFRSWLKRYPDSPRRAEALLYAADVELFAEEAGRPGDLMQAYKWYEEILSAWAGSAQAERAQRRELLVAEMFLFKGKKQWIWGGLFTLPAEEEALQMLDRLADERAPGTPLAEHALRLKADYLYQAKEFDAAEAAYARLARDFPRGRFERQALLRSAEAAFAAFPGVDFDDRSLLNAEERFRMYAERYPDAAAAEGVPQQLERIRESQAEKDYRVGRYYERTGERQAAVYYYRFVSRTWPETTSAAEARQRLAALGETGG